MRRKVVLIVPDPYGFVARWLKVPALGPKAQLRVECEGSWRSRRRLRRKLRRIASGLDPASPGQRVSAGPARRGPRDPR